MRWYSIEADGNLIQIAANDLVGAVIWVWNNPEYREAKTICIKELPLA